MIKMGTAKSTKAKLFTKVCDKREETEIKLTKQKIKLVSITFQKVFAHDNLMVLSEWMLSPSQTICAIPFSTTSIIISQKRKKLCSVGGEPRKYGTMHTAKSHRWVSSRWQLLNMKMQREKKCSLKTRGNFWCFARLLMHNILLNEALCNWKGDAVA